MSTVCEKRQVMKVDEIKRVVCDRCGNTIVKNRYQNMYGNETKIDLRIPVRVHNRLSNAYEWKLVTVDACDNCVKELWGWFNCKGTLEKANK